MYALSIKPIKKKTKAWSITCIMVHNIHTISHSFIRLSNDSFEFINEYHNKILDLICLVAEEFCKPIDQLLPM